MKVIWSEGALADMLEIQAYLEERNPVAAWEMIERIGQSVDDLLALPHRGRMGKVEGTRELIIGRWSYIVVYLVERDAIRVARVMHMARQWPPEEKI